MDIKNALLQADPFPREVYLRAPRDWCPRNANRVWRLNTPAYGLNDAPVEFHKTLKRDLVKSDESLKLVGLRFATSTLGPCLCAILNGEGVAVGVFSTHIDDILGCGAPGVLERTRHYLEQRSGAPKVQENSFVHVGMELVQQLDFSATLTQAEFTRQLQFLDTSPALWKRRQHSLSDEEKLQCQCKMGELCWLATASGPDICARLAQLTSKVNDLQGSDIYRINALIKTAKIEQPRTF